MSNDKFGRTYADTTALQWQGDDINKALMSFDKGVKLGSHGFDDFSRHFMNLSGFDKIPMETRIKLFSKIDDDLIRKTIKDPVRYDWWYTETNWLESKVFKNLDGLDKRDISDIKKLSEKADPSGEGAFQLLALMKERAAMLDWVADGKKLEDFVSYLQSATDGTTNVLQHFAGISRDQSIASAVNMVKKRGVSDAYIQLRDAMDDLGGAMHSTNPLKKYIDVPGMTHAKRRKSVKKGLMTSQYNAGARTLGDGYFEALEGVEVNGKYIFKDAPTKDKLAVGRIMLNAAEEAFPEATKVRYLLNNFAEAHEIAKVSSIEVKTPMGFPFRQSYKKTATEQIELRTANGGRMKINAVVELDEIDYSKQNRAFAPNIIHAMDATHKSLVVNELASKYGVKNFSMIHDSFGTSFGNMSLLDKATRKTFLDMYDNKNFMEFLAENFKSQGVAMKRFVRNEKGKKVKDGKGKWLIEDIPMSEIKSLGDYDFRDFMELEYFFH
jgi:DNA-directed RNA polymerase